MPGHRIKFAVVNISSEESMDRDALKRKIKLNRRVCRTVNGEEAINKELSATVE